VLFLQGVNREHEKAVRIGRIPSLGTGAGAELNDRGSSKLADEGGLGAISRDAIAAAAAPAGFREMRKDSDRLPLRKNL